AIELSRAGLDLVWQVERGWLAIECNSHSALAVCGCGIVVETPVVALAIGVDRRRRAHVAGSSCASARSKHRIQLESFPARPFDVDAERSLGQAIVLRFVAPHALLRMVKAEQRCAVGNAATQRDLARCLERTRQRQRTNAIAVARHPLRFAAVAAKD